MTPLQAQQLSLISERALRSALAQVGGTAVLVYGGSRYFAPPQNPITLFAPAGSLVLSDNIDGADPAFFTTPYEGSLTQATKFNVDQTTKDVADVLAGYTIGFEAWLLRQAEWQAKRSKTSDWVTSLNCFSVMESIERPQRLCPLVRRTLDRLNANGYIKCVLGSSSLPMVTAIFINPNECTNETRKIAARWSARFCLDILSYRHRNEDDVTWLSNELRDHRGALIAQARSLQKEGMLFDFLQQFIHRVVAVLRRASCEVITARLYLAYRAERVASSHKTYEDAIEIPIADPLGLASLSTSDIARIVRTSDLTGVPIDSAETYRLSDAPSGAPSGLMEAALYGETHFTGVSDSPPVVAGELSGGESYLTIPLVHPTGVFSVGALRMKIHPNRSVRFSPVVFAIQNLATIVAEAVRHARDYRASHVARRSTETLRKPAIDYYDVVGEGKRVCEEYCRLSSASRASIWLIDTALETPELEQPQVYARYTAKNVDSLAVEDLGSIVRQSCFPRPQVLCVDEQGKPELAWQFDFTVFANNQRPTLFLRRFWPTDGATDSLYVGNLRHDCVLCIPIFRQETLVPAGVTSRGAPLTPSVHLQPIGAVVLERPHSWLPVPPATMLEWIDVVQPLAMARAVQQSTILTSTETHRHEGSWRAFTEKIGGKLEFSSVNRSPIRENTYHEVLHSLFYVRSLLSLATRHTVRRGHFEGSESLDSYETLFALIKIAGACLDLSDKIRFVPKSSYEDDEVSPLATIPEIHACDREEYYPLFLALINVMRNGVGRREPFRGIQIRLSRHRSRICVLIANAVESAKIEAAECELLGHPRGRPGHGRRIIHSYSGGTYGNVQLRERITKLFDRISYVTRVTVSFDKQEG